MIRVNYDKEVQSSHHLFYKQHKLSKVSNSIKSQLELNDLNNRCLFVTNIPYYANEQSIQHVFNCFGKVSQVAIFNKPTTAPFTSLEQTKSAKIKYFKEPIENETTKQESEHSDENSFRVAYVLFDQSKSLERAIKSPQDDKERILLNDKNDMSLDVGLKSISIRFIDFLIL